jgi:hypothetical protein
MSDKVARRTFDNISSSCDSTSSRYDKATMMTTNEQKECKTLHYIGSYFFIIFP